jgi:autotransporter-associated beta strand protein
MAGHILARAAALAAALIPLFAPAVRGQTWNGPGTDWNTNGNWTNPATFPNSSSAVVNFTNVAVGTVNISASVQAQTLNFSNTSGGYNLTSSGAFTLSGVTGITVAAGVTGTETINLTNVVAGSLLFPNGGMLSVSNDSTAAGTTLIIGPNTVIGTPGLGGVFVTGPGNTQFTGSFATSMSAVIDGLAKSGPGTFTFSGSGANLSGPGATGFTLNGGTLVLDYSTNTATKLAGGGFTLDGGVLSLTANSGTPVNQGSSGTTVVSAGQTDIKATGTGTVTLAAGVITRNNPGATADFSPASGSLSFSVTTSTTNSAGGLLGSGPAFATVGGGSTWATASGGAVAGLAAAGYTANTFSSGTNTDVTLNGVAPTSFTTNSLRFKDGSLTLNFSGTNTLQSGGILTAPASGTTTINGGTITAPSAGELIFHTYGVGPLIVNSTLTSSVGLAKAGAGTLTLGGNNSNLFGVIHVNRGNLAVTNVQALGSVSEIQFNDNRLATSAAGLQQFVVDLGNNTNGTILPAISLSAFSPTFYSTVFSTGVSTGSRITLSGVLGSTTSLGSSSTPIRFTGSSADTSGFNLTNSMNSSTFTGNVSLYQGYLGITSDACLGNPNNAIVLEIADAQMGGLEFLNSGVTVNRTIVVNATTRVVSDGADTNTIAGTVTGGNVSAQLVKGGTGTLTFSGTGMGLVGGGMALSGGTLIFDYSTNTALKLNGGSLTLNGGVLSLKANSGTPITQPIASGTVTNAGHTDINSLGTGTITLAAAALSRPNVGATADFSLTGGVTFTVTTSTGNSAGGLLGAGPAFATVNGGSTWATASGGAVVGLAAGGYTANTYSSGTNTDVTTTSAAPNSFTTNSLRFNTGNLTLTLNGTNTLQSGGILVTPSGAGATINGGALTTPSGGELLFHAYGNLTVNSNLNSNNGTTGGLTKTGPGNLTLGGTNLFLTGPINVNRGDLTVTNILAVSSASAINFNDARSLFSQAFTVDLGNGVNAQINEPIRFSSGLGGNVLTTGNSGNSTITLAGVISSAAGLSTPISLSNGNTSGFNLTNANTFAGNISLNGGSLGISSDASLGNPTNTLVLSTINPNNSGLVFLNTGVTVARPVVMNYSTRVVSNGTDSNTISGQITGSNGILIKDGTGTLTLSNPNNTFNAGVTVSAGTLTLGVTGSLGAGSDITVAAGATFSPATAANGTFGTLTLNGGTFSVPSGNGPSYTVNQIVTNSSGGTVDFRVAGSDLFVLASAGMVAPAITINGNSTWFDPPNGATLFNNTSAPLPVSIASGVTLTNGLPLAGIGAFLVTGGGTLFENADVTNLSSFVAPVTVATGSRFRVTDAASNGGAGNFGSGTFTLDGGTIAYGGTSHTTSKAISLTANGGIFQIESAATTLTSNGLITGTGALTKSGPGTLFLGFPNVYSGGTVIQQGILQVMTDSALGSPNGSVSIGPFGTLAYIASTSTGRTFTSNNGAISVAANQMLTLNNALIGGGFLSGPGTYVVTGGTLVSGVTIQPSAVVNQMGAASFVNVSNGGALTVAAGLTSTMTGSTNQGSGAITIAATGLVNAADFQSYGTLTVNPAVVGSGTFTEMTNVGTTTLYFNGGSRTFIGTPSTANSGSPPQPTFVAGIDLNGKNAVVAGGLFVNNGFVIDSSNMGTGTATIVADFGALVKGAGFFQNPVITQNGGRVQAGNSPGIASFGRFVLGPGGVNNYVFAIDDAAGTAGPSPDSLGHVSGWGFINAIRHLAPGELPGAQSSGDFTWTATPTDKLTVAINTLVNPTTVGIDVPGMMADFDPTHSYSWPAAHWAGSYSGPTDVAMLNEATNFDTNGFLNPVAGSFSWQLDPPAQTLSLIYTPSAVPEPGTLALAGLAAVVGWRWRRRILAISV